MNNPNEMHEARSPSGADVGWAVVLVLIVLSAAVVTGWLLGT